GQSIVRVGDSTSGVQNLLGAVNLAYTGAPGAGFFNLDVDDAVDPAQKTVTISDTQISGLAPAPINFFAPAPPTGQNPALFTIDGGSGANIYTITNTSPNLSELLVLGSGANVVNVTGSSDGGALQGGSFILDGQGGANNTITIGSPTSGTAALLGRIL